MSEHKAIVEKKIEVEIEWADVFSCAKQLLEATQPSDIRWAHVERAKNVYDRIKFLFESKARTNTGEQSKNNTKA
jgi:hypothetical protein